jgi:uncharacterized protein HemX
MNAKLYVQRPAAYPQRQMEGEGVLRTLLLAFALALPMASMAYLKIQHTRLSYAMSEIRDQIRQEEEVRRTLLLERSRFQRDEEIQARATWCQGPSPRRTSAWPSWCRRCRRRGSNTRP